MLSPGNIGMLPMIIPNPIGTSRSGSHSFLMASVMNTMPIRIITRFCHVALANPVKYQNCFRLSNMISIPLCYLDDFRTFEDGVTLVDENGGDSTVGRCLDLVFHLHGLKHGHFLTGLHGLAFLDGDLDDHARKR